MVTNIADIKANVITSNFPKRCKFQPGDKVIVLDCVLEQEARTLRDRIGHVGKVVAMSVAGNGKARGFTEAHGGRQFGCDRQFTRYYIQFAEDDRILGYHSHYLAHFNIEQ